MKKMLCTYTGSSDTDDIPDGTGEGGPIGS
jgi:hypothetical protein